MALITKKQNKPIYTNLLVSERGNNALRFLFLLAVIGVGLIWLYSFRKIEPDDKAKIISETKVFISIGLMISCAAFVLGVLSGFLFGIPRSIANNNVQALGFIDNDNLVQISDWLTKIIVGVGLTQLVKIPGYLQSMGSYLKESLGSDGTGAILAICIVLFFSVCGFLISYLWTRLYFKQMLIASQQDSDLLAKKQKKEDDLNIAIDNYTDSINSKDPGILDKLERQQKENIDKATPEGKAVADIISKNAVDELINRATLKMKNGQVAQSALPYEKRDPNKDQWGGKAEVSSRKLTASAQEIDASGFYNITVTLESTDAMANPMKEGDVVLFSLHDSYPDPYKFAVVKSGVARLDIVSYGSFTVGALINSENTELEFDLANIPGASKKFKEN